MIDSDNIKDKKENISGNELYSDEFDLKEFFLILWQGKKTVLLVGFVFCLSFVIYNATLPNIYTSDSLLQINESESQNPISSLASKYGGLAAMAGVRLQAGESSKANFVIATIKSREFFQHLTTFSGVLPSLFAAIGYDEEKKATIYDINIYNPEKGGWQTPSPTYLEAHHIFLKNVVVSQDKSTGFIYLAVNHLSPDFALVLCNLILEETNNLISKKRLRESQKSLEFLNKQLSLSPQIELKRSINQLLEAQLQIQMLAKVKEDYMLSPIDRAVMPLGISGPNRLKNSILGLLLGLFLGIFFILLKRYFYQKD